MLALLFHGVDIFYDERSKHILEKLNNRYSIKPYIVGTMGITSLFDSEIEGIDLIFKRPSVAISELRGFDSVLIVLKARSIETARTFLGAIGDRADFKGGILGIDINTKTLFELKSGISDIKNYLFSLGFSEETIGKGIDVTVEGNFLIRTIRGCNPGEFLLFNGLVVGKIFDKDVKIFVKDKNIERIQGVEIKNHGLEKIKEVDIFSLKVDSTNGFEIREPGKIKKLDGENILFINHNAYSIYENLSNISGAVTVGDDTTRISGYILYRFGVPLIGIIDGDKDGVLKGESFYKGSVLFEVEGDDISGDRIKSHFFKDNLTIKEDFLKLKNAMEEYLGEEIKRKIEY
ncbi:MAG: hypothetical protein APG12_01308 [Candidatus Methanofastidiosum methylothiophilum]|uniref:DUF2117 domain-containing protein n=1 Tax=Candidatus Methanofastidiosum methylothiophilum TaxID=1705564 RepID=A0A150IK98_9EURY|nr:MAG: hypothetical protein APG10_01146 [Candidatus Methanofastidiosum methylthiophilus]KYC48512.1 MAG: hypothetical protein APG11_00319 [Candidatus Methanofastidiosum methylthiophilus]KYC49661.1 MAG: hypothetical protein APG12_01308 [Candidatus Methanofastidiosum methylthiophilus]